MIDLKHMNERIKKHDSSAAHINNNVKLAVLGQTNIQTQLDSIGLLNFTMIKLPRTDMCVRFCGAFELALRGHEDGNSSLNASIFLGLINFSSELDALLRNIWKEEQCLRAHQTLYRTKSFKPFWCMPWWDFKEIKKAADFLAVKADETTHVSNACERVNCVIKRNIAKTILFTVCCNRNWTLYFAITGPT